MDRHIVCVRCGQQARRNSRSRSLMCIPCLHEHSAEGRKAINLAQRAMAAGTIPRAKDCLCVDCGEQARDQDHRDYTKPLEVVPVCRACNQKRGQAFDSVYRPALVGAFSFLIQS